MCTKTDSSLVFNLPNANQNTNGVKLKDLSGTGIALSINAYNTTNGCNNNLMAIMQKKY